MHRVNRVVEEYLYSAMEDFQIDIMIDQGPRARSVSIPLEPYTLVGATTENPSFELNNALLSRARVYVLQSLDQKHLVALLERALTDAAQGLAERAPA